MKVMKEPQDVCSQSALTTQGCDVVFLFAPYCTRVLENGERGFECVYPTDSPSMAELSLD
jgi:hypothetical protein